MTSAAASHVVDHSHTKSSATKEHEPATIFKAAAAAKPVRREGSFIVC